MSLHTHTNTRQHNDWVEWQHHLALRDRSCIWAWTWTATVLLPDNFLFTSSAAQREESFLCLVNLDWTCCVSSMFEWLRMGGFTSVRPSRTISGSMLSQVYVLLMHCQAALYGAYIKKVGDDQKQQVIFQKINLHISHAKARSQREFEWTLRQVSLTLPGYVQVGLLFFYHQQIFLLSTDFPPLASLALLSLSILLFFFPRSVSSSDPTFFASFCSFPHFFLLPLLPLLSVRSCLLWVVPDSYKSANVNHHVLALCSIGCTDKATKSLLIWMWYTPCSLARSLSNTASFSCHLFCDLLPLRYRTVKINNLLLSLKKKAINFQLHQLMGKRKKCIHSCVSSGFDLCLCSRTDQYSG